MGTSYKALYFRRRRLERQPSQTALGHLGGYRLLVELYEGRRCVLNNLFTMELATAPEDKNEILVRIPREQMLPIASACELEMTLTCVRSHDQQFMRIASRRGDGSTSGFEDELFLFTVC